MTPRHEITSMMQKRQQARYRKEKALLGFLVALWLLGAALGLGLLAAVIYLLVQIGQSL